MTARRAALVIAAALSCLDCDRRVPPGAGAAENPTVALSTDAAALMDEIARGEAAGRVPAIPERALSHHDARVRRRATKALARLADPAATSLLERRLHDEDGEVVAWAAHGLGLLSNGRESETVLALAARLASLPLSASESFPRFSVTAADGIADALARAGTAAAEQTLRALLAEHAAPRAAARALARLASRTRRLDDRTTVALLSAAARPVPVDDALAAFAFLEPSPAVAPKLLEIAKGALGRGGPSRSLALRALYGAGPPAVPLLVQVLLDPKAGTPDRSLAAKTLGRLGEPGQEALAGTVTALFGAVKSLDEHAVLEGFSPLVAALSSLTPPVRAGQDTLAALTELDVQHARNPAVKRRLVALRCGAAVALAGTASHSTRLVSCDPDPKGRAGALAVLDVLDRGELVKTRFDTWKPFTDSADVAVRRRALQLVARHPEAPAVTALLESALAAKEPGIVVEAARALVAVPRQATGKEPLAPDAPPETFSPLPSVVDALGKALDAPRPPDQIEVKLALSRTASALAVLSLKPRVEALCRDERAAVRRGAEAALRSFGTANATCPPPETAPKVTAAAAPERLELTFVTDAGRLGLTLDPTLAPAAVSRISELCRTGFYDHTTVGRIVPGFVVQLGDPVGDGYSGSGKGPLLSETSPSRAGALSVGLAVSGRDTGSSQFFVTLSDDPSIDVDYPLVGYADPEWANAAEGDVITAVELRGGGAVAESR